MKTTCENRLAVKWPLTPGANPVFCTTGGLLAVDFGCERVAEIVIALAALPREPRILSVVRVFETRSGLK